VLSDRRLVSIAVARARRLTVGKQYGDARAVELAIKVFIASEGRSGAVARAQVKFRWRACRIAVWRRVGQ
jgi:hypothetical protein